MLLACPIRRWARNRSMVPLRADMDVRVARRHRLAKSHTLHPARPSEGCPLPTSGWVTIPFSAIQFSGSAATDGARGLSVGGAGFLVQPVCEVKQSVASLSRGTAQPWGFGRRSASLARRLRRLSLPRASEGPLAPTLCRRLLRPPGGPCPSTGCGCYGSLAGKQEIFARPCFFAIRARIRGIWAGWRGNDARGRGGAPGSRLWNRPPGGGDLVVLGTAIALHGTMFGGSRDDGAHVSHDR